MNIAGVLEEQARHRPHRLAIIEAERSITFGELNRAVGSSASELAAAGVTAGMRVLVFSRMSIGLYTTLVALFRLRATAVFVDPSIGRERLERCVERIRPGAFVAMPRAHWLRLSSAAVRAIPIKAAVDGRVPGAVSIGRRMTSEHPVEACVPETPAIITFTSGSTGEPKAAVRTHGFLLAQHRVLETTLGLHPADVDLCTLPIFLLANLGSGVTSVIPDADLRAVGAIDPAPVVNQILDTQPTRTVASPAFLARLVEGARQRGITFDSFRHVHTGGAPVFPVTLDALAGIAPHASVVAVYGSTEAEPMAAIDRLQISDGDRVAMTRGSGLLVGRPVPSVTLRIVGDAWGTPLGPWSQEDLARQVLPAHTAGEIIVTADHVLTGYLDGAGDDETKLEVDGRVWHRTGDAGYLDREGRLWLLGRCSAKVTDSDGVVYPFTVETAASDVPGVARTAFLTHGGKRVLVVEAQPGAGEREASLRERLAWAQLAEVRLVKRIPVDRRHNAKVDYPALVAMLK